MLKTVWKPTDDTGRLFTQGDPAVVIGLELGTDDVGSLAEVIAEVIPVDAEVSLAELPVGPLAAVPAGADVLLGELWVAVGGALGAVSVGVGAPLVVVGFGEGVSLGADVPLGGFAVGAGVLADLPTVAGETPDRGDWRWWAVDPWLWEAASAALVTPAPRTGAAW